jgi:hypothetical protein
MIRRCGTPNLLRNKPMLGRGETSQNGRISCATAGEAAEKMRLVHSDMLDQGESFG